LKDKIKIEKEGPHGKPRYFHLEPVVDYMLQQGNKLAHDFKWGSDKEGFYCCFSNPLDFEDIQKAFDFPDTIILIPSKNMIYCETTRCVIKIHVS
jgi:hypothetical protein